MYDDVPQVAPRVCAHSWINPEDPLFRRVNYVPVMGPLPHQMKPATQYVCNNCKAVYWTPHP